MKDEYTFVTLDDSEATAGDYIFVDMDDSAGIDMDFVRIDDAPGNDGMFDDNSSFIVLDDADMFNDRDIMSDIGEADVSIFL